MRYDGILFEKIRCSKFKDTLELPILFSFKTRKVSEKEMIAYSFLPPEIEKLLEGREFLILEPFNGGRFNIVKAYAQELKDGECKIVIEEDSSKDRRLFERFSFCPEEVGEFKLQRKDRVIRQVYIFDMSLKGIKLFLKGQRKGVVKRGEFLTLIQEKKVITVKVLWDEERRDGLLAGCEVVKTNFNIMKFIMDHYVSHVKELLLQNA